MQVIDERQRRWEKIIESVHIVSLPVSISLFTGINSKKIMVSARLCSFRDPRLYKQHKGIPTKW